MKNMVMMGAIAFKSPSNMQPWAIRNVSTVARRGSGDLPLAAPKKFSQGKTSSRAKACRIRGPPSSTQSTGQCRRKYPGCDQQGPARDIADDELLAINSSMRCHSGQQEGHRQIDRGRHAHGRQRASWNRTGRVFKITRHVGPGHDARHGRKEESEDREKVFTLGKVWQQIVLEHVHRKEIAAPR